MQYKVGMIQQMYRTSRNLHISSLSFMQELLYAAYLRKLQQITVALQWQQRQLTIKVQEAEQLRKNAGQRMSVR